MDILTVGREAITELITSVRKGYEARGKREVGGHLLGRRIRKGFRVDRVVPYFTSNAGRTFWAPNAASFERKGRRLETPELTWVGMYHSHVEIAGSASTGFSDEDKETHIFPDRPVEIIVRVSNYGMNWPGDCLSLVVPQNGYTYYYDICGSVFDPNGEIRRMKVVEGR